MAGEFPLTRESTYLIGRALGHDLIRGNAKARVVIGQDTRESSRWIADRVWQGLASNNGPGVTEWLKCHAVGADVVGMGHFGRSAVHSSRARDLRFAGAISAGAIGLSLGKLNETVSTRTVPLTGMMAALIFAAQMVNFPLMLAPASGHMRSSRRSARAALRGVEQLIG